MSEPFELRRKTIGKEHDPEGALWPELQQTIEAEIDKIVEQYASEDRAVVDQRTATVAVEINNEEGGIHTVLRSRKKTMDMPVESVYDHYYRKGMEHMERQLLFLDSNDPRRTQAEQFITNFGKISREELQVGYSREKEGLTSRVNEDIVAGGPDWMMVCDGVGHRGRNVVGMMGEACATAARVLFNHIRTTNGRKTKPQIENLLRHIPVLAGQAVEKSVRQHPSIANRLNDLEDSDSALDENDFLTTMELVYAPQHATDVYILHAGDSRTYLLNSDGTSQQLTTNHSNERGSVMNYVWFEGCFEDPELITVRRRKGMRLISMTDGMFESLELFRGSAIMSTMLHDTRKHPVDVMIQKIQDENRSLQYQCFGLDDQSCSVMEFEAKKPAKKRH